MGKADKIQDKARQAAEQAKAKVSETRQQISGRPDPQRTDMQRVEDEQERAEQAMRDAGIDRG